MGHTKKKHGFTLIEMLVVIAIIAIVGVVTLSRFSGGKNSTDLSTTGEQIASVLRQAESQSESGVNGVTWGVHFSNATNTAPFYAIFQNGYSATGTTQYNRLPGTVAFATSSIPLGSSLDITFAPGSGFPASNTISLYSVNFPSIVYAIAIRPTGLIAENTNSTGGATNGGAAPIQNIWVTDDENCRVQEFSATGTYELQFGNSSTCPYGDGPNGTFQYSQYIARDSNSNIWVTDFGGERAEEFTDQGAYISQIDGHGGSSNGGFGAPTGVAVDSNNDIWILDVTYQHINEFTEAGTFIRQFGSYGSSTGQFESPEDIAFDPSGNLWVADTGNQRLQEFSATGTYLATLGSYGTGNGQFESPYSIAFSPNGTMMVSDISNNRIEEFVLSSGTYTYSSQISSYAPTGVAYDNNNDIWVLDNGDAYLKEFSATGTLMHTFGSNGSGNGQFQGPLGLLIQ